MVAEKMLKWTILRTFATPLMEDGGTKISWCQQRQDAFLRGNTQLDLRLVKGWVEETAFCLLKDGCQFEQVFSIIQHTVLGYVLRKRKYLLGGIRAC